MPRIDVNRSGEMETFVQVADRGGFSAAARALGMTPSAVSKLVSRLEARLSAQLVHRSTRKLQLTVEGRRFYERSLRVLADIDEAERCAGSAAAPRGRVSINTSVSFGHRVLMPLLPELLAEHPELSIDVTLTDRIVDLLDEPVDIAVRWGRLPPSDLIARHLGSTAQVIVGSPAYLAKHGTPRTVQQLLQHNRLGSNYRRDVPDWPLVVRGRSVDVPVSGSVRAADGETLGRLALHGIGLARLSRYHVHDELASGALVAVMQALNPGDVMPIHAVYLGKAGRVPARVRAVLDFLAQRVPQVPGMEAEQAVDREP
jgi:DNA-binding transcriptional LysR family regulator